MMQLNPLDHLWLSRIGNLVGVRELAPELHGAEIHLRLLERLADAAALEIAAEARRRRRWLRRGGLLFALAFTLLAGAQLALREANARHQRIMEGAAVAFSETARDSWRNAQDATQVRRALNVCQQELKDCRGGI